MNSRATVASLSERLQSVGAASRHRHWRIRWASLTLAAAAAATAFDAVLLQRKRTFFTGGFLSVDHVKSLNDALAFVVGALVADAAVVGLPVAVMLWASARLGLRQKVGMLAAIVVALAPILLADVISYQLLAYLGDAFDLSLMFELAGRNPGEILAVSSAHLVKLMWLVAGVAATIVLGLWALSRRAPSAAPPATQVRLKSAVGGPAVLLLVGLGATGLLRASSEVLDNGLRRKPSGRILGAVIDAVSDVDRDGYGVLGRPADPAPFDAAVHPYAPDVPLNGVDEDGVAGDLTDGAAYVERPAPAVHWRFTPNVVMIVLESFRADALGATFEGQPVTPVLDALAAKGISASLAYSHNGYTAQSRHHIFSGSLANIRGNTTLLDDFKRNGYETAYFSGQDESFGGPDQAIGFERADVAYDARADRDRRYTTFAAPGSLAVPFNVLTERVAAFLKTRRADRPLFLYVNFHDTHFPYTHRTTRPLLTGVSLAQYDIRPDRADALRAMYLNTAANVDRAVGDVLDRARRTLGGEPAAIVLADHGESLFDEGFLGHGYALNDAQTRIPFVVANLPVALTEPFGQADLRDAVATALSTTPGHGVPQVRTDSSQSVFQYLGTVDRPAQIAFVNMKGRIIYDFRSRRVRVGDDPWRHPEDLEPSELRAFRRLVHTWERMVLARITRPAPPM